MGIGVVLLMLAVVGAAAAAIGSAILAGTTARLTQRVGPGRSRAILFAALLPFASLVWVGAVFVFQWAVNDEVFGRDPGLGDGWYCPLPNGYSILMIDTMDTADIYNPRTQLPDSVVAQDDTVARVTRLQLAGPSMLGMTEDGRHFLLDTRTGRVRYFAGLGEFNAAARSLGIAPNLVPAADIYFDNRLSWFDFAALALLVVPPGVAGVWGLLWILRLRRQAR